MSGKRQDPYKRFWAKVDKTPTCWLWTAADNGKGYGLFRWHGRHHKAHRISYTWTYGDPGELQVDHICHNRRCIRPSHLRAVTNKQNSEHRLMASSNTSGARGAVRDKVTNRWSAQVGHNGKRYHGGCFATVEEAAEAARALRLRLYTHNDDERGEPS